MKILLVDDDVFLRDMYSLKFVEAGFVVQVAEEGSSALRILEKEQKFDAILLDMIMPGISGLELIETIQTRFPNLSSKCIVLSNQGQSEDIEAAKRIGAAGYIIKAETIPSEVVKQVKKLLET